jgi:hypothetical protein
MFKTYSFTENGQNVTTEGILLRGGPEGLLLGAQVNFRDDPSKSADTKLITPSDRSTSDTAFIESLIESHGNYKENVAKGRGVPYSLPVGKGGYNSNSLMSGAIKAAGGQPKAPSVSAPLYENPVPEKFFKPLPKAEKTGTI